MSVKIDVKAIESEIDRIIEEAKAHAQKIISDARKKAKEIMSRPIPLEQYNEEAEKIKEKARKEAEKIVKEAEKKAEEIKKKSKTHLNEAVDWLVKVVAGV